MIHDTMIRPPSFHSIRDEAHPDFLGGSLASSVVLPYDYYYNIGLLSMEDFLKYPIYYPEQLFSKSGVSSCLSASKMKVFLRSFWPCSFTVQTT
jgi:hypothetical protein